MSEQKFVDHQICIYCLCVKYASKVFDSTLLVLCSGKTLGNNPKKHLTKHPKSMAKDGSKYVCYIRDLETAVKLHNSGSLTYTSADSTLKSLIKSENKGKYNTFFLISTRYYIVPSCFGFLNVFNHDFEQTRIKRMSLMSRKILKLKNKSKNLLQKKKLDKI